MSEDDGSFSPWVKLIFSLLLFLSLTSCYTGPAAVISANQSIEVHAHRGGAALHQENSLAAFHCAVAQVGADAIELDIRPTADQMLVINHNSNIVPAFCLDPHGKKITADLEIANMTLDEIRSYDCGTLIGLPPKTPLPTLDEVFESVEKLKTPSGALPHYDLHVKWDPTVITAQTFVQLIISSIQKQGVISRVHLMNDTEDILSAARELEPTLNLYYLVTQPDQGTYDLATRLQVSTILPSGPTLNGATVKAIHQQGFKVIPWTVDGVYQWMSLMNLGVDGIMTDNPVGLKTLLKGQPGLQQNPEIQ